jgi:D-serine deaminase-like pyridoxal phosphate-dependent protein
MSPYVPPIGAPRDAIDTPALLLDRGRLENNIRRMADLFRDTPIRLRPHFKSHKCIEIARLQLEAGAVGITCAKLGEAEVLADAGVQDILVANQVVGPIKIARLIDLERRSDVMVAVDDVRNVEDLSAAAVEAGVAVRCLVEVDIGMDRCGVRPGEQALDLAHVVASSPGLVFTGLQAYEGHLQEVVPYEERRRRTLEDVQKAIDTRRLIEAAGIPVAIVSGGGSGTHTITGHLDGIGELQVGSYATMDAAYAAAGGVDFENALTVLATVISRPASDRAIVDAGLKAITPEFGEPRVLVDGATFHEFHEEHGELLLEGNACELQVGDKLELIPSHGCTTFNLYDTVHVLRDGRLVERWTVAGRGRTQ